MINNLIDQQQSIQLKNITADDKEDEDLNLIQNIPFTETQVIISPVKKLKNSNDGTIHINNSFEEENEDENHLLNMIGIYFSYLMIFLFPPLLQIINMVFLGVSASVNANTNFTFFNNTNSTNSTLIIYENGELSYETFEALGSSNIYINVFLSSFILGLNFPFETLAGQAIGNKKIRVLGKIYFISQLYTFILSTVILVVSIFLGQKLLDIFISTSTTQYILHSFFKYALIGSFIQMNNLPNLKLMTVTKKIVPLTIIHSITLSVGVATSYVFVVYLNLGLKGSCFANICAFSVQYFAGLIYIFLIKPYPEILISLKKYDFSFLGTYIVMALPTIALMILFNVAQESIAVFLLVNYEQNYSAYLVLIQIGNIILVSAICFESSMAILVAQNSDLLSRSSLFLKIILPTFLIGNLFIIVACGIMTILYFTIEDFFNLELSVFQIIKIDFFWWMIYIFVQNNLNLMLGIFRGIGRFLFPAIFNLVVIVFITVPVSYVLTIILDWKSAGTWIAMAGGSFLNFLVLMITFIVVYNSDDELKKKE